jgi:hypothetical protein
MEPLSFALHLDLAVRSPIIFLVLIETRRWLLVQEEVKRLSVILAAKDNEVCMSDFPLSMPIQNEDFR